MVVGETLCVVKEDGTSSHAIVSTSKCNSSYMCSVGSEITDKGTRTQRSRLNHGQTQPETKFLSCIYMYMCTGIHWCTMNSHESSINLNIVSLAWYTQENMIQICLTGTYLLLGNRADGTQLSHRLHQTCHRRLSPSVHWSTPQPSQHASRCHSPDESHRWCMCCWDLHVIKMHYKHACIHIIIIIYTIRGKSYSIAKLHTCSNKTQLLE